MQYTPPNYISRREQKAFIMNSRKRVNLKSSYFVDILQVLSIEFLNFRIWAILNFHTCTKNQLQSICTLMAGSIDFAKFILQDNIWPVHVVSIFIAYSKTCVKRPLKNRQNKDLNDKMVA